MTTNSNQQYRINFGLDDVSSDKGRKALEHALDIRKFEIGLYWQRATYFWTLIAATFAGYFAVLSAEDMLNRKFNAFVLACFGLVFSLAWFLTNRGSKFWQENWENHVDMLEDSITGPLYKTVLHRPGPTSIGMKILEWAVEGPRPFSVSQLNQWVSLFTLVAWFNLLFAVLPKFAWEKEISWGHVTMIFITLIAWILMLARSQSSIGKEHKYVIAMRPTSII